MRMLSGDERRALREAGEALRNAVTDEDADLVCEVVQAAMERIRAASPLSGVEDRMRLSSARLDRVAARPPSVPGGGGRR